MTEFTSPEYQSNFDPSVEVQIIDGVLSVKNDEDLQTLLHEISLANTEEVVNWQKKIGFESYLSRWYEIILAQEQILDSLEALPKHTQDLITEDMVPVSGEYMRGLKDGIILEVVDSSGTSFDYNLSKPHYCSVANTGGLFKAGTKMFLVGQDRFGVAEESIANGLNILKTSDGDIQSEDLFLLVDSKPKTARGLNSSFGISNPWHVVESNKKRVKVEVIGNISPTYNTTNCTHWMTVDFVIRTQAEKKSWGRWRKRSSFSPRFEIQNGIANYHFQHASDNICTEDRKYATSGLNACFRSSPFNLVQASTNNGYFCVRPDGVYQLSISNQTRYFFDLEVDNFNFNNFDYAGVGTLPISFHGFPNDWNDLVYN